VGKTQEGGEGVELCFQKNVSFLQKVTTVLKIRCLIEFRVLVQRIESKNAESKERTQAIYTGSFHNPEVVMSPLHFQGEFH